MNRMRPGTIADISATPAGRWRGADIRLSAVGLLGILAWTGYRLVFAQFQGYDDEGYLLVTVQQFDVEVGALLCFGIDPVRRLLGEAVSAAAAHDDFDFECAHGVIILSRPAVVAEGTEETD